MSPSDGLFDQIQSHVVELETTDPEAGIQEFDALADVFEDSTIVGMGEATHGTREFFQLKHRLLRFLVEEHDVRLFGLEANFSETLAINDYVLRAEGDPEEALDGIYFWTWNTEEVLALIEWLREYNGNRSVGDRVKFYGFDSQFTAGPAVAVESYLRDVDPDYLREWQPELEMLADEGLDEDDEVVLKRRLASAKDLVSALAERFRDRESAYVEQTSETELELARQHRRTMEQAIELYSLRFRDAGDSAWTETRDEYMAENVSWILDHEPSETIAMWAHNEHVKKGEAKGHWGSATTMGEFLHREFGERYYALGFEFGSGSFQAYPDVDEGGEYELEEFSLAEPFDGSLPETLSELDRSLCFLDFESASEDARVRQWLGREQRVHSIGALFYAEAEKNRSHYVLADEFDGLIYVDETSRAIPL